MFDMVLHEASVQRFAGAVTRPDIVDFAEVLTINGPYVSPKNGDERRKKGIALNGRGAYISDWARLPGWRTGASVHPSDWVVRRLMDAAMEDLSMYFDVVSHENGWSLIIANYDQIIGSKWLAYVRTNTIPTQAAFEAA